MKIVLIARFAVGSLALWICAAQLNAQVSITSTGVGFTQSFSIGTSATAAMPTGWKVDTNTTVRTVGTYSGAGTATTQVGGTSLASNASNGIYNLGSTADSSDRAVGFLSSSSATKSGNLYVQLQNNTGGAVSSWTIGYDVEKYRGGTNAAGFSIQMYYSTDGTSWTSAGSNFLTSFVADATNNGYASAPGATTSITGSALNLSVASGNSLYLAWNYSVTTGTTTSNAQALAIDNFSITAASAVPEPSTYAAMAGAVALLGVMLHRRRRANAAAKS